MAGERVTIGKNCQIKIVYNDVPYTFRVESFNAKDDAELRKRQFVGWTSPDTDRIEDGYSVDGSILDSGPGLDAIMADMKARNDANLPPRDLQFTLTRVFRDGVNAPLTATFTGAKMDVDINIGSRTDDVKRPFKAIAADVVFA